MANLKKTLSSKFLLIAGGICYLIAFLNGVSIVSDALKTLGFIILAMGLIALNREIKQRKKEKKQ